MLGDIASELFSHGYFPSTLINGCSPAKFKNGVIKLIAAKMWKYISRVSKVVNEKKNEKAPKAAHDRACDTREYEKTRTTDVVKEYQGERYDLQVC